jgi:phosphatidylglycerol:prolipoprotein diacylglycerol transferase
MFPTLSYLIAYLFGVYINLPIQTLGLFMALAFVGAYMAFSSELKRYEALGRIHAWKRTITVGAPISAIELTINVLLGFLFGYKVVGMLLNYAVFSYDPKAFILSWQGNIWAGLICSAAWGFWAWYDRKKAQLPQPKVIEQTVHPYQLMVKITIYAGVWGFLGAKLFDTVEHLGSFFQHPLNILFSSSGFTYYGGFVFGMLAYFYVACSKGMKLTHVADMGAPGIMLAYGIGRIGCALSGDGDWGIINMHPMPKLLSWLPGWTWSYNYPHNVINAGYYIPGCKGEYCSVLPLGVYPTSLYEVVLCLLIFAFLWAIRKHVTTPGFLAFLTLILMGVERFPIELIRVTLKYNVLGLMLTQAQLISIGTILVGACGLIYIYNFQAFPSFKLKRRVGH